jgi:hypothetical protein
MLWLEVRALQLGIHKGTGVFSKVLIRKRRGFMGPTLASPLNEVLKFRETSLILLSLTNWSHAL